MSVFDEEAQETQEPTKLAKKETQVAHEDGLLHQLEDTGQVNKAEEDKQTENGLVNRGPSSIDSDTDVFLSPFRRKNSTEQTSSF